MAEHARGRYEGDVEAATTGFMPERLGEVRFSDTAGPWIRTVSLRSTNRPVVRSKICCRLIEGLKTEIELLKRFPEVDRRAPKAALLLLLGAPLDFISTSRSRKST
jgi:hypothetical protein